MSKKQGARARIPIVMCIDIEPDERVFDPYQPKDWLGFQAGWEPLQHWRTSLSLATGSPAHFNWFVRIDPQIEYSYGAADWAITRYHRCFAAMLRAGDEIGLHPHAWRWREPERRWVSDFGDQAWIEHCVQQGFTHFERRFNRPCRSFRFGDRWLNNQTVTLLERLGAKFDLTIEPGRKREELSESFTGVLPDYTGAQRHPYRPAAADFLQCGDWSSRRDLWHIPISTASPLWDCSLLSRIRVARARFELGHSPRTVVWQRSEPEDDYVTMNLASNHGRFRRLCDALLDEQLASFLALVLRTDAFSRNGLWKEVGRNLKYLATHPRASDFVIASPAEALEILEVAL